MTQPGQFGPDALVRPALPEGTTVSAPAGYTATFSGGNLTVAGPAADAVTVTVTEPGRAPYTISVPVAPIPSAVTAELADKLSVTTANATYLSIDPGAGLTEGATKAELDAVSAAADATATAAARGPFAATDRSPVGTNALDIGGINRACFRRAAMIGPATPISTVHIGVGTSSGNISAAICTSADGRANPTNRVSTSGAIPCPGAGTAAIALGTAVTMTVNHWFALSADNSTATFTAMAANTNYGGNPGLGLSAFQDTAHPIPATPAPSALLTPGYLMVGV